MNTVNSEHIPNTRYINPFLANVLFLNPLETRGFFNVLRGKEMEFSLCMEFPLFHYVCIVRSFQRNIWDLIKCCDGVFMQKHPMEVLLKKGVLKYFSKFTGKHLCQSLFFNKIVGRGFPTNTPRVFHVEMK